MVIAVDAVGGDHYPKNPVSGGIQALNEMPELKLLFVGPESLIKEELARHEYDSARVDILHAPEIISMQDSASAVLKEKKNSSITLGLQSHKAGDCHGFVSAGHTGALLTASTVFLGKIEGVYRPTIAAIFPTINGVRILIDAGANLTLKEEMYYQFAVMGKIFTEEILKVDNPKIGLLNVGEESEKGTELLKASYLKLKELDNFVGNIEGKDILNAKADVFLTDGFTGNILLKFGESIPDVMQKMVKEQLDLISADSDLQKQVFQILTKAMHTFDYEQIGGVPFLGVNGVSFVGHGNSSVLAIKNMIKSAMQCVDHEVNKKIKASLN
ncbi:phosphate acyltransferase PlsX [Rhodohalobacter sp. 8-1]|uniref:phosphate acyltransferase PlsX n=1 Tax=Rhodohalobacter sp. 8-1 TaxID=3131972 RepID=UPI0030EB6B96